MNSDNSAARPIYSKSQSSLSQMLDKLFFAKNPAMRNILGQVKSMAQANSSVLIYGESGTGKEMIARMCHQHSHRASGPFVTVNCAALPEELLESELFGHKKGSFTGAYRDHMGLIQEANGGTLFLDEIGDMSMKIQAKLLRAVQEKIVRPVGDTEERRVDVRIVCATHKNLMQLVKTGEFRDDLYFRLSVLPICIPPLRSRPEDILALARHFIIQQCSQNKKPPKQLAAEAEQKLMSYDWPGNVRELSNVIERALVFSKEFLIESTDIRFDKENLFSHQRAENFLVKPLRLKDLEKKAIALALEHSRGVKSAAARQLGIDRKTLLRKQREYGLFAPSAS